MRKTFIKAAALAAAVTLTAGVPLSVQSGAFRTSPAQVFAADEAPVSGKSGIFNYNKYSDHVVIWGVDSSATDVEIPSSIEGVPVTVIDMYAFQYTSVTSVKIPDTVTEIGNWAFSMCFKLTSVTIPDSVTKIGIRAFESCSALEEVNFPDHLVEVSSKAFEGTPWLDAQRKKDPMVIVNGALIDGDKCEGKVEIPSGVKYVSPSAFARNSKITSVVFPASVSKISDNVCFYCDALTSVEIKGAELIDSMAFDGCDKLTDLKISGKLKKIDGYAFADNNASATITFYGSKDAWDKVEKPDSDPFLQRANMKFDESHVEEVKGDVNADGVFSISDIVLFQKWLLGKPGMKLANWQAADFTGDGKLNVFDLCLMKREYVTKK